MSVLDSPPKRCPLTRPTDCPSILALQVADCLAGARLVVFDGLRLVYNETSPLDAMKPGHTVRLNIVKDAGRLYAPRPVFSSLVHHSFLASSVQYCAGGSFLLIQDVSAFKPNMPGIHTEKSEVLRGRK